MTRAVLVAFLTLALAAPAVEAGGGAESAQPAGQSGQQPSSQQYGGQPRMDRQQQMGREQPQTGQPDVLASGFSARVTGQVTSVDQQSGRITLSTPEGPLTVRFPPEAIQHVQQGDQVTVAVALVESGAPAASPGRQPSSQPGSSPGSTPGSTR